jgi:protein-disulfide isomerase
MTRPLWLMAVCLLSATALAQSPKDFAALQGEVQVLKTQQQQILTSLDELKKLLRTRNEPPEVKVPATLNVAGEPFRGNAGAQLAIIEYADFECPFCRRFEHDTYPQIRDAYIGTGKVKYFYRDLPLPFHPHSMPAAQAARCAAEQGKLWEMHDSLFAEPAALEPADIDRRAGQLGINIQQCMASGKFAAAIQKSLADTAGMQISGTPTFVIGTLGANGEWLNVKKTVIGALPFDAFEAAIDPLLKISPASPPTASATPASPHSPSRTSGVDRSAPYHRDRE